MQRNSKPYGPHRTLEQKDNLIRDYYKLGISKRNFAKLMGVSHHSITRWEKDFNERHEQRMPDQYRPDDGADIKESIEYITIPVETYESLISCKTKMDIMLSVMRA